LGAPLTPWDGRSFAVFPSGSGAGDSTQIRLLSPCFDLTAFNPGDSIFFGMTIEQEKQLRGFADDSLKLEISTDGGLRFTKLAKYVRTAGQVPYLAWAHKVIDISSYQGQSVRFGITGYSSGGNDMAIDLIRISNNRLTALEKPEAALSFAVYPNPTNGRLTISLPEGNSYNRIRLMNTAGQELFSIDPHSGLVHELSLEALPTGIYLVQAQHETQLITQKIVKQ
jgi:hypothetical protein